MEPTMFSSDVASLNIELNELKSMLDRQIRASGNFAEVQQIYFHIKELECQLNALEWDPYGQKHNQLWQDAK